MATRTSDGCLLAELALPWIKVDLGKGVLRVSLDPLKAFLKQGQGDEVEPTGIFPLKPYVPRL